MSESLELNKDVQTIRFEIAAHTRLFKSLLSLQRKEILQQKKSVFIGRRGPKKELIRLYLAIGPKGKTRKELEQLGFKLGTILPYLNRLVDNALLWSKQTLPDGQEVLGYTEVEEVTRLSEHLKALLRDAT